MTSAAQLQENLAGLRATQCLASNASKGVCSCSPEVGR